MYEDSAYRGTSFALPLVAVPKNIPFPIVGGLEDKITSLRWNLDPGVRVTFFHDGAGNGAQYRISENASRVSGSTYIGSFHNDEFSSMMWQKQLSGAGFVEVFENGGYGGRSDYMPLGSYAENAVHPLWGQEDRVSSMRWSLPTNVILIFYEHSDGTGREYTVRHDTNRNSGVSNVGSFYNDKFSSWSWRRVDPAAGWVQFHTNTNYAGYQFTRYLSETGLSTVDVKGLGYNDQFDSARWSLPSNRTIMAFDESPAGGRALPLIDSGSIGDFNSFASGLHHDKISTLRIMDGQLTAAFADRNAPLDEICQLAAHNAHASRDQGWIVWYQQTMSVVEQLDYGARLLQLDVLDHTDGRVYLVHGSYTASIAQRGGLPPQLLGPQLDAIHAWLVQNPKEVVFIDFQNDAGSALAPVLAASPLDSMITMPRGLHWPSTNELVASGKRCIVVDSKSWTSIPYHYDWAVQNGFSGFGDASPRAESDPIDARHKGMFYMNHISGTSTPITWVTGSPNNRSALVSLASQFDQPPTFIGIDGIQMADHGGLEACRFLNAVTWPIHRNKARTAEFHGACGSASRLSTKHDSMPRLGTNLRVNAPSNSAIAIGVSDVDYLGVPLPAVVQGSSCRLRVAPLTTVPSTGFALPIPNMPNIVGLDLMMQAVTTSGGQLGLTNGLRVTCGL